VAKLMLFSTFDRKAEVFARPFCERSTTSAMRAFSAAVQHPESGALHEYPEDFDLYLIGTFDDDDGSIEVNGLHLIANAAAVMRELEARAAAKALAQEVLTHGEA